MRSILLCGIAWFLATTVLAEESPPDKAAIHATVQKAVQWLEVDMRNWRDDHNCSACHHGPMYLWSINVARRQGYQIDETQLRDMTRWLLTSDEARVFPKPESAKLDSSGIRDSADRMTAAMMGRRNLSQPTLYLTHALNFLPDDEPLKAIGWQRVVDHLADAQSAEGSFEGRDAWRPIFNTPQILTRFAAVGLAASTRSSASDKTIALRNKAEKFLSRQANDETHQGLVLQLLAACQQVDEFPSSDSSANKQQLIARLKQLQRPDGGWAQTSDRESDAFASGQTLYALEQAGVSSDSSSVLDAIAYLVRTQRDDGTWPISSRPNPETGKPADFLNPITYAATAWATLGSARYVPRSAE